MGKLRFFSSYFSKLRPLCSNDSTRIMLAMHFEQRKQEGSTSFCLAVQSTSYACQDWKFNNDLLTSFALVLLLRMQQWAATYLHLALFGRRLAFLRLWSSCSGYSNGQQHISILLYLGGDLHFFGFGPPVPDTAMGGNRSSSCSVWAATCISSQFIPLSCRTVLF